MLSPDVAMVLFVVAFVLLTDLLCLAREVVDVELCRLPSVASRFS